MVIKIFLFHRVSAERDILWDPIDPKKFEELVKFISKNYEIVQLENSLLDELKKSSSKPLAAIVFDDGYKDFMFFSLPILKKYRCDCSMYIVTNCVEQQLPPWTYVLDYHFIHSKKLNLNIDFDQLPIHLRKTKFKDINKRLLFAKNFKPYLKTVKNTVRINLYNQVLASLDDVKVPSDLIMNWRELQEIKSNGVTIGSHTMSHPLLNKIENEIEIVAELKGSGDLIKKHLGHFPKVISYPIGSYNPTIKKIALNCGYKIGLAVNQMTYNSLKHDLFEIPRIELYHESMLKSRLRVAGVISCFHTLLKQ